jgi:hypothetical protein
MALRSERRFISKSNIQSGMLLEFSYTKKSDGSTKSYMVLVIDPSKENENTKTTQLHGILIDDLSDEELIKLVVTLGNVQLTPDERSEPLVNLQSDEAYDKYVGSIKGDRRYRTFVTDNIANPRQILLGEIK